MRTKFWILAGVAALAMSAAAQADTAPAPSPQSAAQLLEQALQGSLVEVELGKLAQKNAQSTGVNALGARLERDHARIGKVLASLSRDKGVVVPTALDDGQRARVEALGAKTGAAFDAAYTAQMVGDHKKAIALFTAAAESNDPDLSQLAKAALPTLREDERLAASFSKMSSRYDLQAVASE